MDTVIMQQKSLSTRHLRPHLEAFQAAARDPEAARLAMLSDLLAANRDSGFGRDHGFDAITSLSEWQRRVPVRDYEGHRPWIDRLVAGDAQALTGSPALSLSPTSGSSGGNKRIPFTAPFASAVERAVGAWLADLSEQHPEAVAGPAYWSISPPLLQPFPAAGSLPVHVAPDLAYFGADLRADLQAWLLPPPSGEDRERFFRDTVDLLLRTPDLALVSVWSPTFLILLDDALRCSGECRPWSAIWPKLRLISAWTHGESARWLPDLRRRIDSIPLQGKGLLATEGVVSIPLGEGDPVLALTSHLIEFRDGDATLWPDQASLGGEYEVLISNQAGLYRYATGDRVRVSGWYAPGVPRLCFLGRGDTWVDQVGEKLSEAFVGRVLADAVAGTWSFLVGAERGYTLVHGEAADARTVRDSVDLAMRQNPYYAQACDLGQLRPLASRACTATELGRVLQGLARRRRCRLGDVKMPVLLYDPEVLHDLSS